MSGIGWTVAVVVLTTAGMLSNANAAALKGLFPGSLKETVAAVIPQFEQSSGNKVTIVFSTAGAVATKVRNGEAADLAISSAPQIADLQKQGKVVTDQGIAKVGVGVLVRKGASKPNIGTVDALKAALLSAKGISYTDPALGGPVGIYVAKLLDQLGIGAAMKLKTKLSGPGAAVSTTVVNGEAEIGFIMINEVLADPRVELVGSLPEAVQMYTQFAAGVIATSTQQDAANALSSDLASPSTLAIMKKLGFESY
jgi:molybdate transport system substrate-binding protein